MSGTTSAPTNEPEPADTRISETLATELGSQLAVSAPLDELPPGRRFVLIITGTTPGLDLTAERDAVLSTVEAALHQLVDTHGVVPMGAAYRSDPMSEPPAGDTATAEDAPSTEVPTGDGQTSSSAPSSPGSSDGTDSNSPESASPSDDTQS